MTYHIRAGRLEDVAVLQSIERAAAKLFLTTEFADVAEGEPRSKDDLEASVRSGWALVVCDQGDRPVGFLLFEPMGEDLYLREIDVQPEHAGQRLSARLIEAAGEIALGQGLRSLSLSTFRNVPFNGPYYSKLGFQVIEEGALTPGMQALREREAQSGLDVSARVLMRKVIAKS